MDQKKTGRSVRSIAVVGTQVNVDSQGHLCHGMGFVTTCATVRRSVFSMEVVGGQAKMDF